MKGVEHDGGRRGLKDGGDIGLYVDRRHPVALLLQRMAAGAPRGEADLALGRPAAHEDRNVFGSHSRSPSQLSSRYLGAYPEEPMQAASGAWGVGSGEWGVGSGSGTVTSTPQAPIWGVGS